MGFDSDVETLKILNVLFSISGSGGGKYSRVNRKITVLNCDVVRSMLKEGGATHAIVGDNLSLPIRSCSLDAVIRFVNRYFI